MTWDGLKGGEFWRTREGEEDETRSFFRRIRRARSTLGKKPQTLFWYSPNVKCCFGDFFQQNLGLCRNLD